MIKCKNEDCSNEYCCIECNIKSSGCTCEILEELSYDEELVLKKCEYAEKQ